MDYYIEEGTEKVLRIALIIAIVASAVMAVRLWTGQEVSNRYLNECAACGAFTQDRYPVVSDDGTKVWVCPHCDEAIRDSAQ